MLVSVTDEPPPTGVRVVEYPEILAPPLDVGAEIVIFAEVLPEAEADVIPGALGGAAGVVIVEDATVSTPLPTALVATTLIEYCVPAASPEMVIALLIADAVTVSTIVAPEGPVAIIV